MARWGACSLEPRGAQGLSRSTGGLALTQHSFTLTLGGLNLTLGSTTMTRRCPITKKRTLRQKETSSKDHSESYSLFPISSLWE